MPERNVNGINTETTQVFDGDVDDQIEVEQPNTFYKILRTVWLIATWASMGSFMEVAGTTLKDFVYRLNTDYGSISGAYAGRSVGKFIGSVLGGILVDRFGRYADLMIAISLSLAAVSTCSLPWVQDLQLLWFLYFVLGLCLGIINIAGQRILLCTWLEKSASPMHIMHLGYGAGGFIVPLILNPFLADLSILDDNDDNNTVEHNITTNNAVFSNSSKPPFALPVSKIEYGYSIIAVYTIFIATIFYIYQCFFSKDKSSETKENRLQKSNKITHKRSLKEMINPASCADGNFCFGTLILGLLFLRYFWIVAVDRTIGTFLRSYAIDQLRFSKDNASFLNTFYWISYSVGRLIMFVVARWVSIRIILLTESVCTVVVGFCLLLFALNNQTAMWALTFCIGIFLGPMFPSGIAWGNFHIDMTGTAMTFILLGSGIGGFIFIKMSGSFYDIYGPPAFVYLFVIVGAFILANDIALTFVSLMKKRLVKKKRESSEDDENEKMRTETEEVL